MVAGARRGADLVERPDRHLVRAPRCVVAHAPRDGIAGTIDVRALGMAVVAMDGGRRRVVDAIDASVGLVRYAQAVLSMDRFLLNSVAPAVPLQHASNPPETPA